jgi:hypothetical protein
MLGTNKVTPFEAYTTYLALKNHFTKESYDFFKYGGKGKASQSSFEVRKDKYFFHKLSKHKDVANYIVANILIKDNLWVGDLVNDDQSNDIYTEWLKRQQSLSYLFKNELVKLDDDLNKNILVEDGQHPHLLNLYKKKIISDETLIILNSILGFFKYWDKNISEEVIWPKIKIKLVKYTPFISFDKNKMKMILKERFEVD